MKRVPVESSNVESVGYDPAQKVLEVGFKGGSIYQYADVPAEMHSKMMAAPSVGSFLHREIKPTFACKRVS